MNPATVALVAYLATVPPSICVLAALHLAARTMERRRARRDHPAGHIPARYPSCVGARRLDGRPAR